MASSTWTNDPVFQALRAAYWRPGRQLVLFAGAGVSMAAGLPSWTALVRAVMCMVPDGASRREGDELCRQGKYPEALSIASAQLGTTAFEGLIVRLLSDEGRPVPSIVQAIGNLSSRLKLIVTTNLDGLIERGTGWPSVSELPRNAAQQQECIFKIHGTLTKPESWVLIKDRYEETCQERNWIDGFSALYHGTRIVFVGYGLEDADLNRVIERVRILGAGQYPEHFAILPRETSAGWRYERLRSVGVKILEYDPGDHEQVAEILRSLAEPDEHLQIPEYTATAVTAADLTELYRLEQRFFRRHDCALSLNVLTAWHQAEPRMFRCLRDAQTGVIVGYFFVLFLRSAGVQDFVAGRLGEGDLGPGHLVAAANRHQDSTRAVYVGSLCADRERSGAGTRLVFEVARYLEQLDREARIETIYAMDLPSDGFRIIKDLPFELVNPIQRIYRLDVGALDRPLLQQNLLSDEDPRASFEPRTLSVLLKRARATYLAET